MRKTSTLFFLLFLFTQTVLAQGHASKVHITTQEFKDRVEVYASNNNAITVSLEILFNLKGMEEVKLGSKYKIIEPNRPAEHIATLNKNPNQGWSFRYNLKVYLGDFYSGGHDSTYVYTLPFAKGESFLLTQGYDGDYSHQGENAIDFLMNEGTPIYAMRDGIVAEVVEHNNDGCANISCIKMANSVLVYHVDGSFSRYSHLKLNGAEVYVGNQIEVGQLIGFSGNTGWSSEPHLHFSIFEILEGNKSYSIPTKFMTEDGPVYLEEKKTYRRPE